MCDGSDGVPFDYVTVWFCCASGAGQTGESDGSACGWVGFFWNETFGMGNRCSVQAYQKKYEMYLKGLLVVARCVNGLIGF